jgi:hypothetical protein
MKNKVMQKKSYTLADQLRNVRVGGSRVAALRAKESKVSMKIADFQ